MVVKKPNLISVNIMIDSNLKEAATLVAQAEDMSFSQFVRRALRTQLALDSARDGLQAVPRDVQVK